MYNGEDGWGNKFWCFCHNLFLRWFSDKSGCIKVCHCFNQMIDLFWMALVCFPPRFLIILPKSCYVHLQSNLSVTLGISMVADDIGLIFLHYFMHWWWCDCILFNSLELFVMFTLRSDSILYNIAGRYCYERPIVLRLFTIELHV